MYINGVKESIRLSVCHTCLSFVWQLLLKVEWGIMTHQQLHSLFTSPTAGGVLPYPSSTPYPSRANTPAFSASISSHSSSSGSYGHRSQSGWKAPWKSSTSRKTHKRSQPAPWKSTSPMAYYGYYQQQAPGWGNAEYQPLPPPMPTYQPAPTCM